MNIHSSSKSKAAAEKRKNASQSSHKSYHVWLRTESAGAYQRLGHPEGSRGRIQGPGARQLNGRSLHSEVVRSTPLNCQRHPDGGGVGSCDPGAIGHDVADLIGTHQVGERARRCDTDFALITTVLADEEWTELLLSKLGDDRIGHQAL